MAAKISTILFDLDGTLLDTAPDLATALNVVLQEYNRPALPFTTIRPLSSTGSKGLLGLGFQIDEAHADYQLLRTKFLNAYHNHLFDATAVFPGMETVLQHIEHQGLRWGVVTNKPAELAQRLLEKFNLSQRCACLVGGDTLDKRKPDPEPLFYACELIGVSISQCVYIGDTERDIEAAKRAKMRSIAALYGYITADENPQTWRADYYVEKPEQIIYWLNQQ